jgi:hypothetical protein
MRKLLIIIAVLVGFIGAKAQNPFAEYGYTPKIATLSQGQFNEFFDNDTIVQIGSVLYHTKSREIVAFVDSENLCQDETIQPDVVSRWISPDPLADHPTQISLTPYHYAGNNPIYWTDPDGRCPWCLVWAAVEVGLAIYDAYETGTTIIDPNASTGEKWAAAGGFVLGAVMPGGGYSKGAKETAKAVENTMPAWKKSEQFIESTVKGEPQKVFKAGEAQQSAQRIKGSSAVDVWSSATNTAFEIKNYAKSLQSGNYSGLVSNMSKQYQQRLSNLPDGAKQVFKIDMTDYNIPKDMQAKIIDNFMKGKDADIVQIQFFTRTTK